MLASTGEFDFMRNCVKHDRYEDQETKQLLDQNKVKKNLNYSEKKQVEDICKIKSWIKISVFVLTSLVCLLDGYLLLFIGYNQSIFMKEWKWRSVYLEFLNIIFHIITAIGGIFSAYSTNLKNLKGLNWNIIFTSISFIFSIFLIKSQSFVLYSGALTLICFTNGHIFNIGTNMIIYKFSPRSRAFIYSVVLFFNQFGKFVFATIIYKFNNILILGELKITIFPIIILLLLKLLLNIFVVTLIIKKLKLKTQMKTEEECFGNTVHNNVNDISLSYHLESKNKKIILHDNSQSIIVLGDKIQIQTIKNVICSQIYELFTNQYNKNHSYKLAILNISLGIQFFSMINVFPHLSNSVYFFSNLVDEIFFSKLIHTILLSLLPFLLFLESAKSKTILYFCFSFNLALNFFIIFKIFNVILMVHAFRFLWNVSFISIDLYTAEAINRKYRNINTSLMYFLFKVSCLVEIMTIDNLISISIYIPIVFNIIVLILDILITFSLECEPHFLSIEEIEGYFSKK